MKKKDKQIYERSLIYILSDTRQVFFGCLNKLSSNKNPLPYIFATERREFAFAILLIIMGSLLLLLSTLLQNI